MKKTPLILIVLLTGCTMKPAELKDLSRIITTDYYSSEIHSNTDDFNSSTNYDAKTVINSYLSEGYIVFEEHSKIITFEDIEEAQKQSGWLKEDFEIYLKNYFDVYKPKNTSFESKFSIENNIFVIVERVISPPKPTGWRSWIPDKYYTVDRDSRFYKNSKEIEIDSLPEWTDSIDMSLIGRAFQ